MSKFVKATVALMIVSIIGKVLGFGRELVLGTTYGISNYSDIYIATLNIPAVIFLAVGNSLASIFIPVYYESTEKLGEKSSIRLMNNLINIVICIATIISIIGFIYAEPLVKLFAIGFEGDVLDKAVEFTRIMIWGTIFIGINSIIAAFLQVKNNFSIPGMIAVPYNIIIIISIIISINTNVNVLAYGTLLAMISQVIFQLPFAFKQGYRYKFYINVKDKYIKKIIWLVAPVFIGIATNQVNTIVDRTIASTLGEGSISALNYANRLNSFVIGIFIASIAAVIYPMLSNLSLSNNKNEFSNMISKSVNAVILLVIPISVGAIVLSNPIVKLLFERGAFDSTATNMTSVALVFYSLGMVGFGLRDILGKVFYSLQDTKTPMINGAMAMGLNIILNLILVKFMDYAGLALATSISAIICILLLFNSLKKKIGYLGEDKIIKTTFKAIISAIAMGIVTYFVYNILSDMLGVKFITEAIALFVSIGIGAAVYSTLIVMLKVEEVSIITDIIKKKLKI